MAGPSAGVRVARTIHIHHNSETGMWAAKLTAVDEGGTKWEVKEFVETFLTLAEVIAFIIQILAGVSPTFTYAPENVGDLYTLGKTIANTYAP